mmetsp:Transcript_5222/g.17340  ORF Transcript_5222/g.17340 Transcript_5222/m.17340 type:complete len:321 (-) Transcript_5222:208-1170(-)
MARPIPIGIMPVLCIIGGPPIAIGAIIAPAGKLIHPGCSPGMRTAPAGIAKYPGGGRASRPGRPARASASAYLTTSVRAQPGSAIVPLSAAHAMSAACRVWYRTKAQPLDLPSFSRIRKTSISGPNGAKTDSRSASVELNGTIPTKSLCPAPPYGSGAEPRGGRLGPPCDEWPCSGPPSPTPSKSRLLGLGLFANLTRSGRSAPGSVLVPLRAPMAALASSRVAYQTNAYCARSPLAYLWREMCTTSPCARKTAAKSSSVASRGMLEMKSLRSLGRMTSVSLTMMGLLSGESCRLLLSASMAACASSALRYVTKAHPLDC